MAKKKMIDVEHELNLLTNRLAKKSKEGTISHLVFCVAKGALFALAAILILALIIAAFNGHVNPLTVGAFEVLAIYIGGAVFIFFTLYFAAFNDARLAATYRMMYLHGLSVGSSKVVVANTPARTNAVNLPDATPEPVDEFVTLFEDVALLLKTNFTTGTALTRDEAIKVLSHRSNSKASATVALEELRLAGVIVKESEKRNAKTVVNFDTLEERLSAFENYVKENGYVV